MIDTTTARHLLDFGARMGQGPRADEQLKGAVAIHNILERHRVAYLADEVGMGKTYVALGAVALFRHFQPNFRILVIAPRENIQRKWMKELRNFAKNNVRFTDFRNRSVDEQPGRPLVACDNLVHFVREAVVDPDRDFFARLSSFSLGLTGDEDKDKSGWARQRDRLREAVPWIDKSSLTLQVSKEEFKDNFARAACCALPVFDLVIVDEGHNLKHGFDRHVAARNRVLALAFGHPSEAGKRSEFPAYGPRARRVLFLSATPLEESYRQVWNQLDVFGLGGAFEDLKRADLDDDAKKELAARFLVRRVTSIKIAGTQWTKNQYRREWRSGGVHSHDKPISVDDPRHRLVVALVQKKVAELLTSEKFNMSFQVGMLASFESFLETTGLSRSDEETAIVFDDPEQTEKPAEREGIDVQDINRLSKNYRNRFNEELPHPKMDALVKSLADSWRRGRKALVFVRRVASVKDLKRKLDLCYDGWLIARLRAELPTSTLSRFDQVVAQYWDEQRATLEARAAREQAIATGEYEEEESLALDDRGGNDTFFAWYFRGTGPKGVVSGANVQGRFIDKGTVYSTFFEYNYVADLLGVEPGRVTEALVVRLGLSADRVLAALRGRVGKYLGGAKKHQRANRVEAVQAAALELLLDGNDEIAERARIVWRERFETSIKDEPTKRVPEVGDELEVRTFFTELGRPQWAELRRQLWPEVRNGKFLDRFREQQLRGQLLATAARLGHSLIDLYVLTIKRLGSLELRRRDVEEDSPDLGAIHDYLEILEGQRLVAVEDRPWAAFDELAEIAAHFDLILDVNAPDARTTPLAETARFFGSQLRQQQPVAGMSGQVNKTVVQQFRMPGYPFVLISTDLLQEGEDLHTFCSQVFHYGISWTPSAMEQRIGRIDRVRSQTDRRLGGAEQVPNGDQLLQVFYPYLSDTVEVLQVNRVLARMDTFLRLMHEGLAAPKGDGRAVDVGRELINGRRAVEAITGTLTTAFPILKWARGGTPSALAVDASLATAVVARLARLRHSKLVGVSVAWESQTDEGRLLGTASLPNGRIQPFTLLLKSDGERLIVRCVSPVGRVNASDQVKRVAEAAAGRAARIGAILTDDVMQYDLTVEDDVGLAGSEHDADRIGLLVSRVVECADAIERWHFGSLDQPLATFESDLRREGLQSND